MRWAGACGGMFGMAAALSEGWMAGAQAAFAAGKVDQLFYNNNPSGDANVDPATATKVTGEPKSFVSLYYQSILDKKFDVAFKMQPKASQTGTVADFQSTQEMYGMKAFSIFSEVTGSTEATVVVRQDLGTNGIWNATWTFAKADGSWLVKERKVGMGEPTK